MGGVKGGVKPVVLGPLSTDTDAVEVVSVSEITIGASSFRRRGLLVEGVDSVSEITIGASSFRRRSLLLEGVVSG